MKYEKHLTVFFFSLLINLAGIAQQVKLQSQPSFVAIIVSDIDASIDWYTQNLGLQLTDSLHMESRGFKQANLSIDNLHLELIELNTALTSEELLKNHPESSKIVGFFKLGLMVFDFDQWIDHLTKQEVVFHGKVVQDQSGKRMVIILDPDGNRIQLFEKIWDPEQEKIKTLFETSYLPVVYGNDDPDLLDMAFHPQFNMYVYYQRSFYKRTYAEWKEKLVENLGKSDSKYAVIFESIDITGGTAMVKLIVNEDGQLKYTDYITLYKMESGWQVLTKLFTIH